MYLIGLTGGIASGKSVVSARLAELGALRIDADQLARDVVAPGEPALSEIEREFGPEVISPDGTLNRVHLASLVFSDPDRRAELNAITHPAVKRRAQELMAVAAAQNPDAVVVYDVPLLVEAGVAQDHNFDLVVVVHADTTTRMRRLIELRGLTYSEALHRLNSQASDTERLAVADVVIDSNGTLAETLAQTDALWRNIPHSA